MKRRRLLTLILILIAALVLLATLRHCGVVHFDPDPIQSGSGPGKPFHETAFRVTAVELNVETVKVADRCPATVRFSGLIRASGRGQVQYNFVRSDGATSTHTMEFSDSGVQPVSDTWTLGDAQSLPSYDGWQTLKVLSPNVLESNREAGTFSLTCTR